MHAQVKTVKTLPNFMLEVLFKTGEHKIYDMNGLINKNCAFLLLKTNKGMFDMVKIDGCGYGISWNDNIDLDAHEILINGKDFGS